MNVVLKRLAGFTGFPVLAVVAPFLILPIISRTLGDSGWANYTAGQAIGTLGAIAVLFGWGVIGPVRVAQATRDAERQQIYSESLRTRLLTLVIALPGALGLTALITTDAYRLESLLIAASATLLGLTPNWYCIGIGRPLLMGQYDAIPRIVVSLAAIPVLLATGWVWLFPVLLIGVSIVSVTLFSRRILRGRPRSPHSFRATLRLMRQLFPTAMIDFTGNSYGSTPVPIATATLAPAEASQFSSAERLYRLALLSVAALGDAFQGWVLEPTGASPLRRHAAAIVAHVALGAVGGTLIALLGPLATAIVFGDQVAATSEQCVYFGVALFFISVTTPLIRNILIPAAQFRRVFLATAVAAVFGISTMVALGVAGSSAGVAAGLALSEALIFAVLVPGAVRQLLRIKKSFETPPTAT